jgi:hypothetical protein
VQLQIVRHERLVDETFDDGVPAFGDLQDRLVAQFRPRIPQSDRTFRQVREHIERA